MKGQVKLFSDLRGFGFILGEDGKDYFVHYNMINAEGYRTLKPGMEVNFKPISSLRGNQAWSVEISPDITKKASEISFPLKLKLNPFTPQDPITDPKKFAGRSQILVNAIDCLFNNKNVLVTGARGIGKSSIAYQLVNLTKGDRTLIERIGLDTCGYQFNHLSGDHRCIAGNTLSSIAKGLLGTLRQKEGLQEKISSIVSKWECDLKIFKYSEQTEKVQTNFDEVALELAIATEDILRIIQSDTTGVCYLIDEVDVLDPGVNLAPFLKSVVEKLRIDGYSNVSFILSGVTGSVTNLISQHPSAARLTETLSIDPMTSEELGEIIDNCLYETPTKISFGAKDAIIKLSGMFPAPVHLLGYHAFRLDKDSNIDNRDVEFARDFIVQEIKRQDFQGRLEKFSGRDEANILKVLAHPKSERLTAVDIAKEVYIPPHKVSSILEEHKHLGTFVKKTGMIYEISEPLFRIYLRWISGISI